MKVNCPLTDPWSWEDEHTSTDLQQTCENWTCENNGKPDETCKLCLQGLGGLDVNLVYGFHNGRHYTVTFTENTLGQPINPQGPGTGMTVIPTIL